MGRVGASLSWQRFDVPGTPGEVEGACEEASPQGFDEGNRMTERAGRTQIRRDGRNFCGGRPIAACSIFIEARDSHLTRQRPAKTKRSASQSARIGRHITKASSTRDFGQGDTRIKRQSRLQEKREASPMLEKG